MYLQVPEEFLSILRNIKAEGKAPEEWAEIESDDMFQSDHFVGGYDADEEAFCFSFFDQDDQEYWFQISFDDVELILNGKMQQIDVRPAEV